MQHVGRLRAAGGRIPKQTALGPLLHPSTRYPSVGMLNPGAAASVLGQRVITTLPRV